MELRPIYNNHETAFFNDPLLLEIHAAMEPGPLCLAMEKWIQSLVPCFGVAVGLTPASFLPLYAYSTIYGFGHDPNWEKRYDPGQNPILGFVQAHPGRKFVFDSDLYESEDAMYNHPYYRDVMEPEGWGHCMSMTFWKNQQTRGFVAVFRATGEADFTEDEATLLRNIYPQLQTALERVLKFHAQTESRRSMSELLSRLPLPSLLLDWDLKILHTNREGIEQTALWNFGPHKAMRLNAKKSFRLPAEVVNHCHDWKKRITSGIRILPIAEMNLAAAEVPLIHHPKQKELGLTVKLLDLSTVTARLPRFLVEFHQCIEASDGMEVQRSIKELLTRREFDVAQLVCAGLSNAQISEKLGSSLGTVKKQVSSVLAKLDLQRRSQLVRLLR